MRCVVLLLLVGPACLASGCAVLTDATHMVAYNTAESIHTFREHNRNQRWAHKTWNQLLKADHLPCLEPDYKCGFLDGFAEYLYSGNPEPPAVPPNHYRKLHYQSAKGYRAKEQWFAGYRFGVAVAQEKNVRDFITGPSSLRSHPEPCVEPQGQVISEAPGFQLIAPAPQAILTPPNLQDPVPEPEPIPIKEITFSLGPPRESYSTKVGLGCVQAAPTPTNAIGGAR